MKQLRHYIRETLLDQNSYDLNIAVGGDVMFGRYVGANYYPLNPSNPFANVSEIFKSSDMSIVNLENPLFDGPLPWWETYGIDDSYQKILVGPTSAAADMANHGINLVSLANNHSDDAGLDGFKTTHMALDSAGIIYSGTSVDHDPFEPAIINIKNKNVLFFSVTFKRNFGKDWGNSEEYRKPVAYIENITEFAYFLNKLSLYRQIYPDAFIICSVHWGEQYKSQVEVWQEVFAQEMVESGVNCVLGHHPHVLRKFEYYKDALIFYSLGNLFFDHNYDIPGHASKKNHSSKDGAIFTFNVGSDNFITNVKKHPTESTPQGVILK